MIPYLPKMNHFIILHENSSSVSSLVPHVYKQTLACIWAGHRRRATFSYLGFLLWRRILIPIVKSSSWIKTHQRTRVDTYDTLAFSAIALWTMFDILVGRLIARRSKSTSVCHAPVFLVRQPWYKAMRCVLSSKHP